MSTISSAGGISNYMTQQATTEYYAGQAVPSAWEGRGAETQGLQGEVNASDLAKQLEGKVWEPNAVTGVLEEKQLGVTRGGELQHRAGWDLTFAAPKSVSIESEVFNKLDVRVAHESAVREAMSFLQDKAAQARISGETVNTGNLTYATFSHATSRAGDPQTHTHVIVANVTYDKNGKAYSLSNENLMEYRHAADQVYKNAMGHALEKMGYEVQWDRKGDFEIAAYSREQIEIMSKRSEQMNEALRAQGINPEYASNAARQAAVLDTRANKDHPESADAHRERWNGEAQANGIKSAERIGKAVNEAGSADKAVAQAVAHLAEREMAFKEKDLYLHAAKFCQGKADTNALFAAVDAAKLSGQLIERSDGKFTTKDAIKCEQEIAERLNAGRGAHESVMTRAEFDKALATFEARKGFALGSEQRAAASMVLCGNDRFQGVQGLAGTGKTTMLEFVREAAEQKGWEVRGMSNGGAQADKLQEESGIKSQTTASFVVEFQRVQRDANLAQRALESYAGRSVMSGEPNFKQLLSDVKAGNASLERDSQGRSYIIDRAGNTHCKELYGLSGVNWQRSAHSEDVAARQMIASKSKSELKIQADAVKDSPQKLLYIGDEASMSGARETRDVLSAAEKSGARHVSLGDALQHQSVAAGGKTFEQAQQHMPMSYLGAESIKRQTTEHGKETVAKVLAGKHQEATKGLPTREFCKQQDAVKIKFENKDITGKDKAAFKSEMREAAKADNITVVSAIAKDYSALNKEMRDKTLIVSATNADRQAINKEVREHLKNQGELKDGKAITTMEPSKLTEAELRVAANYERGQTITFSSSYKSLGVEKGDVATVVSTISRTNTVVARTLDGVEIKFDPEKVQGRELSNESHGKEFAIGDKVCFTKNDNDLNVKNGLTGTVEKFDGKDMTVRLGNDQVREFNVNQYKNIDHAYAMTSFKSQGQTYRNVMVHHNTAGGQHGNRETYVNYTRARENTTAYTQNKELAAQQSGVRMDKETAQLEGKQTDFGKSGELSRSGTEISSSSGRSR